MELESKWFSIKMTTDEILKLIPDDAWEKVEKLIRLQAGKEYSEKFNNIDLYEHSGTFEFGLGTD